MIEAWEYTTAECTTGQYWDAFLELHLKRLGAEGWELVHVTERKDCGVGDVSLKGYFKRPVVPLETTFIAAQIEAGGYGRND